MLSEYKLKTRSRLRNQQRTEQDSGSYKPKCSVCEATSSQMWRKYKESEVICNSCYLANEGGTGNSSRCSTPTIPDDMKPVVELRDIRDKLKSITENKQSNSKDKDTFPTRKSSRVKPSKQRGKSFIKTLPTKGKSRRVIFKRNIIRAPHSVATCVTSDYIFYEGQYYQLGDIVSVEDEGGGIYYAQLTGFLCDQYMNKSATITWLLPTLSTRGEAFDPATYILGPAEELPRDMAVFEFVCHAPSDYYRRLDAPYPTREVRPSVSYISTSLGPRVRRTPSADHIYYGDLDREANYTPPPRIKIPKQDLKKDRHFVINNRTELTSEKIRKKK